jgi:hypothetical protein
MTLDGGALNATLAYQARSAVGWVACDGGPGGPSGLDPAVAGTGVEHSACTKM